MIRRRREIGLDGIGGSSGSITPYGRKSYLFNSVTSDVLKTGVTGQGGSAISIAFNINPTVLNATNRIIDKYSTVGTGRAHRLYCNSNGDFSFQISDDGSSNEFFTFTTDDISVGTPSSVVLTFKNGDSNLYIDASLSESHTYTMTSIFNNSTEIYICDGKQSAPCGAYIWDARLFNKELTTGEVEAFHNGAYVTGALAWYKTTEWGSDTSALDSSGNGNDGVITADNLVAFRHIDSFGYKA